MPFNITQYCLILLVFLSMTACRNTADKKEQTGADADSRSVVTDTTLSDSARLMLIEQLADNHQYGKALSHIDWLLQKKPYEPAFLFIKANILENLNDTAKAINFYLEAEKIAGSFLQAKMKRLQLYAETGNDLTLLLSDSLYQLPETEKIHSDILLMKGIYFTKKRKYKDAEQVFNMVLKNDYTNMQAYLEKGWLYYDQQQFQKALNVFELSTTIKNDFAEGYFWQGKTLLKINKKEEATQNFKKSLALDPELQDARDELRNLGAIQ